MAHPKQMIFLLRVKMTEPHWPEQSHFHRAKVLDCGSLDINGNNRFLFTECDYIGIDVGAGANVDYISLIHNWDEPDGHYDTIISTEAFEHDPFWKESIANIIRLLRPGGLFIFTCASGGRGEHGTEDHAPEASPLTVAHPAFENYYWNLEIEDVQAEFDLDGIFAEWYFERGRGGDDLYFWGIKR